MLGIRSKIVSTRVTLHSTDFFNLSDHCFGLTVRNFTVLIDSHHTLTPDPCFQMQAAAVSDLLVNIVENLAAKELDIFLRSW